MTKHSDEILQEASAVCTWFHFFFAIRFLRLPSVLRWFHFGRPECLNVLFCPSSEIWFSYRDSHHFCIQGRKLWFSSKESQQKCHPVDPLQKFDSRTRNLISSLQNIMYFFGFLSKLSWSFEDSHTSYKTSHVRIIMTVIIAARVWFSYKDFHQKLNVDGQDESC